MHKLHLAQCNSPFVIHSHTHTHALTHIAQMLISRVVVQCITLAISILFLCFVARFGFDQLNCVRGALAKSYLNQISAKIYQWIWCLLSNVEDMGPITKLSILYCTFANVIHNIGFAWIINFAIYHLMCAIFGVRHKFQSATDKEYSEKSKTFPKHLRMSRG